MPDYQNALRVAIDTAREGGRLLQEEFHRRPGPREIDHRVEEVIRDRLRCAFPWNYLGEELGAVTAQGSDHTWVVDPNDGTSHFLKGRRGSAVAIAALRQGQLVLGVVFAFCYPDDSGDLIAWAEGCGPITRNGQPVTAAVPDADLANPHLPFHDRLVVFLSPDADRSPLANSRCVGPARYIRMPSIAYRLALVAVGEGVATLSLNGPVSWDYAAGHAILQAAGGGLVDRDGHPVTYTTQGRGSARDCFGGGPKAVEALRHRDWASVLVSEQSAGPRYLPLGSVAGHSVADPARLARAQGCLLGQFAGDTLGGLVEFKATNLIQKDYPDGVRDMRDGGTWRNIAGQLTDDSEMALMLARTLVHHGRYDPGAALDAYLHWWPQAWDHGSTLSAALGPASRGKTAAERLQLAGEHANHRSQSNGSLMRICPLGIFGASRLDCVAGWARQDSGLTHPNPVCKDACAVFISAIAHAVARGGGPESAYQAALAEASRPEVQPAVLEALTQARHAPPADYASQMGWVLIALQNAFYQLLHAPTLEAGVIDTISRGGDTDTTAAIAGALLGAVHGREAVPGRWVRLLLSCRPLPESGTAHPMPPEFWPVEALEIAEALLWCGETAVHTSP